jgi:signal transduction histidine kinase
MASKKTRLARGKTKRGTDPAVVLEKLEGRYERFCQIGMCLLAGLSFVLAFSAVSGTPVTNARTSYAISVVTAVVLFLGIAYFLVTMRSMRREIGERRVSALPSRAERIGLIRRVGELSAVIDASRELESARSLEDLCERLATESAALASSDAALVVLRRRGELAIAAATDETDEDDVALAAQCQGWTTFLDDGALPLSATGPAEIEEAFGEGPLAGRYGFAMEVPLLAHGRPIGLVVALRKVGSKSGFDANGLQAVGLLADVASHLILLRRVNSKMGRTNQRLVQSMDQLERAQAQLVNSEKLRAVGELVSGVAHELNNPLTSLLGFAQLLTLNNSVRTDSEKKWVDEIQREASRCSVILQNLLGFARKSAVGKSHVATAAIVSETLALKAYDVRNAKVQVKNAVSDALPALALDRQELQQVLLNLINNAVASMRTSPERVLTISSRHEGDHVVIEVADTGSGIPEDQLERIFEPFVSTKAKGDSIGLGLTTCRKIVNDAGGTIAVRSEVGKGSAFAIRLPVARELVGV